MMDEAENGLEEEGAEDDEADDEVWVCDWGLELDGADVPVD